LEVSLEFYEKVAEKDLRSHLELTDVVAPKWLKDFEKFWLMNEEVGFNYSFTGDQNTRRLESREKRKLMVKDSIAEFWKNADCLLDEVISRNSILKLLIQIRETLEDASVSAQAINERKPMQVIASMG
jgi:hypothetical protein